MALIKCIDAKKGSGEEVELWTNSKPTSSFTAQSVTLSDSIFNYSYIKIIGRISTSKATEWNTYVTPTYLSQCSTSGNTKGGSCLLAGCNGSNYIARMCAASSNTEIAFGTGAVVNVQNNDNNSIIPTSIVGIK